MTIEEMKDKKKEKGYSYEQMADLSGIPLGTIQKIFSGETKSPRYDTLMALEQLFTEPLEDYYALPEDKRYELIDGVLYEMTAPTTVHQIIALQMCHQIVRYTDRLPIT